MGSIFSFFGFLYVLSMFISTLLLIIIKLQHPHSTAVSVWVDLGLLGVVSTVLKNSFCRKSYIDVELMVYVLGFIKRFHSKGRYLKEVRGKIIWRSFFLLQQLRQCFWHSLHVKFFQSSNKTDNWKTSFL